MPPRWRALALAAACTVQAMGVAPAAVWAQSMPAPLPASSRPSSAPLPSSLPALGDSVSGEFGVGTERQLGDRIVAEIRRDPAYFADALLDDYVDALWQRLLAAARARGEVSAELHDRFAWQAFLLRERSVNAFALPGGYVGVHLGLIALTSTRDELASVLAHELSHVTQRHIARSLVQGKQQSLVALASMIVGVLAASRSPQAANAMIAGGQAVALQSQLNFSREMEREADRIGFLVLEEAGFAAAGMSSMFEKLQQNSRVNDSGAFPYLRTHPLTSERIGEARARQGAGGPARPTEAALEHALMQARARVLMDPRPDTWRAWLRQTHDASGSPAAQALALATRAQAAAQLREFATADAALAQLEPLLQDEPRARRAAAMLRAETWLLRGDAGRADAALASWRGDGSRGMELLSARIGLAAQGPQARVRLQRSAEELQAWVALRAADLEAWELLGQAWERLGQPLRAVRAQAEARYLVGDMQGAIDRLRSAQSLARTGAQADFIEASVIDARLRVWEDEWRRRLREEAGR